MKVLSKLKLLFTPSEDDDAVNKKYVDELVSSGNGSSIYYGNASILEDNNSINLDINGFDLSKINSNILLIIKSTDSTILSSDFTENVFINNEDSSYRILDSYGNNIKHRDLINSNTSVLGFNGLNFILLNKQYLIDSHSSKSTDYGATANSVKVVYDHFTDIIGDIPEVLDTINRKVV